MPVSKNVNGFVAGTLISMADGTVKPIEKIQSGELVMSFDQNDASAPLEPKEVQHVFKRLDHGVLEVTTIEGDPTSLRVAPGQLFINPGDDWHFATETALIVDAEGKARKFKVDNISRGKFWMYDVTVDDHHSLIANGIRVHNFGLGDVKTAADTASKLGDAASKLGDAASKISGGNTSRTGGRSGGGNGGNAARGSGDNDRGGANHGARGTGPQKEFNKKYQGKNSSNVPMINKKNKNRAPDPDPVALAISTLSQIRDQMNFICSLLRGTNYAMWLSYKGAAISATDNSLGLAASYLDSIVRAKLNAASKSTLISRHGDIATAIVQIKAELSKPDSASIMQGTVLASCDIVNLFVSQSLSVFAGKVGNVKQSKFKTKTNSIPQVPPMVPYTPPPTYVYGGTGAGYTQTQVVNGVTYVYYPGIGWQPVSSIQ